VFDQIKKQFASVNILITLLIVAVGMYVFQIGWQVIQVFSDIIVILVSAWLISFILEPFVEALTVGVKIARIVAAAFVYIIFFALVALLIFLFIPIISTQMQSLFTTLPKYLNASPLFIQHSVSSIVNSLGNSLPLIPSLAQFVFYIFLVFIISFYFVMDKGKFDKELYSLTPKKWHVHIKFAQETINRTFGSFIRVQLLFGLIGGIATWIVLAILHIPFAASTSVIAGIMTSIPVLGPILGIIPPVAIAFFADPTKAIIVFVVLLAMQQILFNIIAPKLLGSALKLHPVVVLLSFIVGFKIFGTLGAIFAAPMIAVIVIVLHRLSHHFFEQE